ncbi:WSC domain-containing protein 1-like [Penaeus japonicus]|uniref:WSC domain-containing protein 1-like n=1 Tax=Penaeus japonicus TaxID=27405 RepID=UPI001C70E299|nr:WSC domain-containing protein 1-like [Penaeus japonicus]
MELPQVSLRSFFVLVFLAALFTIGFVSEDFSIPLQYPNPKPSAQAIVDSEERADIDQKRTPSDFNATPGERIDSLSQVQWPELDPTLGTAVLWPDDPACAMHNVSFPLKIKKTFLVSFPRSGNTWTRYLIEGATGLPTGATYLRVRPLFFGTTEMRKVEGKVILTKIHFNNRSTVPDDVPVILLLRNPAKSIISYYNFKMGTGAIKRFRNVSYSSYFTNDFANFFDRQLFEWTKLAKDRLLHSRRLLVIPYEKLQADPIAQVRKAIAFLGVPTAEARLACLRRHLDGPALGLQRQIDPYTTRQKLDLAKAVSYISQLLRRRNFPPLLFD